MSSPGWYQQLAESLRESFEKQPRLKHLNGEQFLRDYLEGASLSEMNDEDSFIEEHIEPLQDFLDQKEWIEIDKDSLVWLRPRGAKTGQVALTHKDQVDYSVKLSRLDDFVALGSNFTAEDIEEISDILLIKDFGYKDEGLLRYKVAKSAAALDCYTNGDKAKLWELAAFSCGNDLKKAKYYEYAADLKCKEFRYEEAVRLIKESIYIVEVRYKPLESENLFERTLNKLNSRISLFINKSNKKYDELLRLVRKYRMLSEQAGLLADSSQAFVYESDTIMQRKKYGRVIHFLFWLFSKYGESPIRVLATSFIIMLIWACLYSKLGITYNLNGGSSNIDSFTTHF